MSVTSPAIVAGLINGTTYSVTIDGRTNGGPGGAGTPSVSGTPVSSGGTWTVGTPLGNADLRGVVYGTEHVIVGSGGAVYTGPDGISWSPVNIGVSGNLNAVAYGTAGYVLVGDGGVIRESSDAIVWNTDSSPTGVTNLYSVTAIGNVYVAVGAGGAILYSTDAVNWAQATSGTTNDLYSVVYGNGMYVAVGANGTLLSSSDAVDWGLVGGLPTNDLRAVGYGIPNSTALFVAAGTAGTLLVSGDGVDWAVETPIATPETITGVSFGSQFVASGTNGTIFTSIDGINWTPVYSGVTANLNTVYHTPLGHIAVGSAGTNIRTY